MIEQIGEGKRKVVRHRDRVFKIFMRNVNYEISQYRCLKMHQNKMIFHIHLPWTLRIICLFNLKGRQREIFYLSFITPQMSMEARAEPNQIWEPRTQFCFLTWVAEMRLLCLPECSIMESWIASGGG